MRQQLNKSKREKKQKAAWLKTAAKINKGPRDRQQNTRARPYRYVAGKLQPAENRFCKPKKGTTLHSVVTIIVLRVAQGAVDADAAAVALRARWVFVFMCRPIRGY